MVGTLNDIVFEDNVIVGFESHHRFLPGYSVRLYQHPPVCKRLAPLAAPHRPNAFSLLPSVKKLRAGNGPRLPDKRLTYVIRIRIQPAPAVKADGGISLQDCSLNHTI
jgi:hypothetical protein